MSSISVDKIIDKLELKRHPEGGHFRENYRSKDFILPNSLWNGVTEPRNYCTGIYFLLNENEFSAFHKIKQDEMWHHYIGTTLLLHIISPAGNYQKIKIGKDLAKDEQLQYVVPANHWFASEVLERKGFVLCGCTVSPGFDFKDFEMPTRESLIKIFPQHRKIITNLTYS
tara:strand:+ start:2368 stop:2877 length:510 start_codon:yes stop_codon:yes gene_type:complete